MKDILEKQKELMNYIPHGHKVPDRVQGSVVASMGIIEETMEYLNAIGFKSWRPIPLPRASQLEELTDILFFYSELVIYSGFTFEDIKEEYYRKWEVNMDRY
ncbi:unnamed protein product, partial [marine sediment metagenome]